MDINDLKKVKINLFGGEGAEGYNALMQALEDCARDDGNTIYKYLEHIPKTSLIVELVDKLEEYGYIINKPLCQTK